jgi:hypothetical protein
VMRCMMSKLRLTVNETKTRRCRVPAGSFDFLGNTIGLCWSPKTGKSFIGTKPSAKQIARLKRKISDQTSRNWCWMDVADEVMRLNRMLLGCSNYFCLGPVSSTYQAVDSHARFRLRQSTPRSGSSSSTSDGASPTRRSNGSDSYSFLTSPRIRSRHRDPNSNAHRNTSRCPSASASFQSSLSAGNPGGNSLPFLGASQDGMPWRVGGIPTYVVARSWHMHGGRVGQLRPSNDLSRSMVSGEPWVRFL